MTTQTTGYQGPSATSDATYSFLWKRRQIFQRGVHIPMMRRDPRLSFAIELLKGPIISKVKFEIETENEECREYVERNIRKFWTRSVYDSLDCIVYGYHGAEVLYEFNPSAQQIDFKQLKSFRYNDVRPGVKNDKLVGMKVRRIKNRQAGVFIRPPKCFWAVHNSKDNPWFGTSRLERAFEPWWEAWQADGYRDVRQLWFYKNAYNGGVIRFPQGNMRNENGVLEPNSVVASRMLDKARAGATVSMPKGTTDLNSWDYEAPKGIPVPAGLLEYGADLKSEEWEGMGIPPEVLEADGTGAFAGRKVPMMAYYSTLQSIANEHFSQFNDQVLKPLVKFNCGEDAHYEAYPIPILDTLRVEELESITGGEGELPAEGEEEEGAASGTDREPNEHNAQEAKIKKVNK